MIQTKIILSLSAIKEGAINIIDLKILSHFLMKKYERYVKLLTQN
jgi:hypothetical protein